MKKLLAIILLFALGQIGFAFSATQEKRVALVIGNDAYQGVTKLEKAVSDAKAIGEALKKAGFEVLSYSNLDRRGMNQAIGTFTDKVAGGGVGVFFFAGHGVQAGGTNFLLPVDIKVKNEQDLLDEAVDMQRILERMSDAKAKLSLLVIDACRDNPFKKVHGRSIGATRGLAVPQAPSGTLVVYSAGIGQQALDKLSDTDNNPNGLFTREFLPAIATPGLRIDEAVKKVRSSVIAKAKAVGHEQNPAIYDQTDGDFYFVGSAVPSSAAKTGNSTAQQTVQSVDPMAIEMSFWDSIKSSSDPEDFQEYLRQYPRGKFSGLANNRLRALSRQVENSPRQSGQNASLVDLVEKAKNGDSAALKDLNRLAGKGDATAQAKLGSIYAYGWGVAKDEAEAVKWFRKSANSGNAEGQFSIGWFYETGREVTKDEAVASKWYRKSADQGLDRAQYRLGLMYELGRGVVKDEADAFKWYRKAADQGHASAQTNLGWLYEKGLGIAKNETEAVKWYRKGADQGVARAQNNLGWMYESGRGVAKDEAEAVRLYRQAADQGHAIAQNNLGRMFETGKGTARNEAEAVNWYRKSAEQDNAPAQYNLGRMYKAGRGIARDESEAVRWYRKAAEKGHKAAMDALSAANISLVHSASSNEPGPKEFCADRPNFISKGICERRECEKPRNAKNPYCEQYRQTSTQQNW